MKGVDFEIEGSVSKKGFDMDIEDDVEGRNMSIKGGFVSSSQKKNKKTKGSDSDQDSDYEEGLRRGSQKKGSGGKGLGNRGQNEDRVFVPSDDEFLICKMEREKKNDDGSEGGG